MDLSYANKLGLAQGACAILVVVATSNLSWVPDASIVPLFQPMLLLVVAGSHLICSGFVTLVLPAIGWKGLSIWLGLTTASTLLCLGITLAGVETAMLLLVPVSLAQFAISLYSGLACWDSRPNTCGA